MELKNIPTVMVILGATGDLTARKIIPALFNLHKSQGLPDVFRVERMFSKKESLAKYIN